MSSGSARRVKSTSMNAQRTTPPRSTTKVAGPGRNSPHAPAARRGPRRGSRPGGGTAQANGTRHRRPSRDPGRRRRGPRNARRVLLWLPSPAASLGGDGDEARAGGRDVGQGFLERRELDGAVGTRCREEGDHHRPLRDEIVACEEPAFGVGQQEVGEGLADAQRAVRNGVRRSSATVARYAACSSPILERWLRSSSSCSISLGPRFSFDPAA